MDPFIDLYLSYLEELTAVCQCAHNRLQWFNVDIID